MGGGKKAPASFWSMESTVIRRAKPNLSQSEALLREIQTCLNAGNVSKAVALVSRAVERSDNIATRFALATVSMIASDFQRAEENYLEVLRRQPRHFKALLGLGQLKLNDGQAEAAIKVLEAALKIQPGNVDARHLLARSYGSMSRYDDAIKLFQQLIVEAPNDADIWSGYGRALAKAGSAEGAIEAYQRAQDLKPDDDAIQEGLGGAYLSIGLIEKAEQHLRKAAELKPERGVPFRGLAKLNRLDNDQLTEARRQLAALPAHDPKRRTFLAAIAAVAERDKNYEEAFRAISEAISIRAGGTGVDYEPNVIETVTTGLIRLIGMPLNHASPPPKLKPIFIIGMPRSGSTLTEQIFAQHPEVFAAGEWSAMNQVSQAMRELGKPYPEGLSRLTAEEIAKLRELYFANLHQKKDGKTVLTDKRLGNVLHLPLIELTFPEAKIIRCRRHPMDIVWSIMTQVFGSNVPFGHKIEDICHHMLQQQRVFDVWAERGTLATLEVFYEELIDSFETRVRSLVKFAGLPWNDACLTPQESRRAILTASAGQVHRPISKSSIGRWKPFAPHLLYATEILKPLIELHEADLSKRGIKYGS